MFYGGLAPCTLKQHVFSQATDLRFFVSTCFVNEEYGLGNKPWQLDPGQQPRYTP